MRKLVALFALAAIFACEKKEPAGNLHITGNIAGLKKGTVIIKKMQDTMMITVDSIAINGNSNFESHSTIDSPQMLYMYLDRGVSNNIDNSLNFFAEPGNIKIETTLDRFYANAKITGSKNHDLLEEFKKVNSRFTDQHLELTAKRLEAFKNKTLFDEADYIEKAKAIESRRYLYAINFAVNHRDKEIAPYIAVFETRLANIKLLEQVRDTLTAEISKSKYGKMLSELISERKQNDIEVVQNAEKP